MSRSLPFPDDTDRHARMRMQTQTPPSAHTRAHANADPSFHTPQTHSAAQHTLTYRLCHVGKAGRSGGVTTTTFVVHVSFVWFSLHTMSSTATQGSCGKCIAIVEACTSFPSDIDVETSLPTFTTSQQHNVTHGASSHTNHTHSVTLTAELLCSVHPVIVTVPSLL